MSKVLEYVGVFQLFKDRIKEAWTQWRTGGTTTLTGNQDPEAEIDEESFKKKVKQRVGRFTERTLRRIDSTSNPEDFSHLTRKKTRKELAQVSAAVMGIEFSYAAETAFVSPLLLKLGLRHRHMTLIWCLSPLMGFFLTPILGSLSDGCTSQLGRRRPFIILLSIGIILGLILVPNGQILGRLLGDVYKDDTIRPIPAQAGPITTVSLQSWPFPADTTTTNLTSDEQASLPRLSYKRKFAAEPEQNSLSAVTAQEDGQAWLKQLKRNKDSRRLVEAFTALQNDQQASVPSTEEEEYNMEVENERIAVTNHPWGLIFTVVGTVLLDFDADACQSPSRAYMLDVTIPEDHARGLSTFTIMAGLGGSLGYLLGAFNWDETFIGELFGNHVRAVFTLVLFIYIACVVTTVRSFREIPIDRLWSASSSQPYNQQQQRIPKKCYSRFQEDDDSSSHSTTGESPDPCFAEQGGSKGYYGAVQETSFNNGAVSESGLPVVLPLEDMTNETPTFREYMKTIVRLPKSLAWLCATNFFCWMSLVCYSLYFTDFVGEIVFGGNPSAPKGSGLRALYESGVRFGCLGMSLYSLSCSIYSFYIDRLVEKFGAKRVYICGQLTYSVGMVFMAIMRHPIGVLLFSSCAGVMYATLFTMPYLLVARYHAADTFDPQIVEELTHANKKNETETIKRGLGTDVAIVSSMVFLAQMTQALTLGSVVNAVGSVTAIVVAASIFAFCGALCATKIMYLDL